ncbi:MAG: LysM peptidoglycan-binding domain-containing protein [bacterium]|nr:LysM peptidoglycan-binding domain-containing protein [bacterium]
MRYILLTTLLLLCILSWAQPGVSPEREVDGKRYYVHSVQAGNTLWGLQQMYGVPADEIMEANPVLSEGLKKGQTILIPIPGETVLEPTPTIETSEYKVKKGETLYGLSRKFNTTVDELIRLNPVLAESSLQKGQRIKVPGKVEDTDVADTNETQETNEVPNPFVMDTVKVDEETSEVVKVEFNDSIVEHTVLAHEPMYSISKRFMVPIETILKTNGLSSTRLSTGQVLKIPLKQERINKMTIKPVPPKYDPDGSDPIEFEEKERYKIAVFLPFFLEHGKGYSKYVSDVSTQFYMGMTLAMDTLEAMGLKADIHYYDTKRDSATVLKVLNSAEFQNTDLVIGPFFPNTQKLIAEHCKQNAIRMVVPVSCETSMMEGNRLVYAAIPSDITLMRRLGEYVAQNHTKDRVLLVKPKKEEDMPLYEAFRDAYNSAETEMPKAALNETTQESLKNLMTRNTDNILIMPTNNRYHADKFVSTVSRSDFRARKDGIYIYGTKDWVDFESINNDFKNRYNFRYASSTFRDYYTDLMIEVNRNFRTRYKTDMGMFAVQGYDILLEMCSHFFLEEAPVNLLANDFNLQQISPSDGYENNHIYIIEQEDYELVNTALLNDE